MRRTQRQKQKTKKTQIKTKNVKEKNTDRISFYDKNYKQLIIIPMLLLLVAIILITVKVVNEGEFLNKGITLSGGVAVTVIHEDIDKNLLRDQLELEFPSHQINVRSLEDAGRRIGVLVETNMPPENTEEVSRFDSIIRTQTNAESADVSTETIGSSLGQAFFRQTILAVLIAFIFMGIVIFAYFKSLVPSSLTILSAFSDIIITLAIVNVLGINIGTAGIAAFLMLIGYSVDANIVLNMRTLKGTNGTIPERIRSAMGTGLTMSITTLVAITVAFIIAESAVLKEIMLIMMIGLIIDVLNTWIQNAGLLRWYLERKKN
ncbi:MAG: protein translocase subunit SecF [Candidatus Woesearchaeota archaeon]